MRAASSCSSSSNTSTLLSINDIRTSADLHRSPLSSGFCQCDAGAFSFPDRSKTDDRPPRQETPASVCSFAHGAWLRKRPDHAAPEAAQDGAHDYGGGLGP